MIVTVFWQAPNLIVRRLCFGAHFIENEIDNIQILTIIILK